jgi:chorismate synthase
MQKYGFDDARNVLERASARETAARVAAGALAKVLLDRLGVSLLSHVVALGPVRVGDDRPRPTPADRDRIDASPLRCADPDAEAAMRAEVEAATAAGDSLGGVVEVLGHGVPPGLGSHVHWDRRIDGRLAAALMSIQAMKGVEIGDGFAAAARRGSAAHDEILWSDAEGYTRASDRAGGVEGGMTTGGLLAVRVAMKPLATLRRPVLRTVDTATKEETRAFRERTDVTAVPAAGVVAEAMVALVLADEALRKFGGDSVAELVRNHDAYRASLR